MITFGCQQDSTANTNSQKKTEKMFVLKMAPMITY